MRNGFAGSVSCVASFRFFFFNDTATTEIYTLSLHDALPIYRPDDRACRSAVNNPASPCSAPGDRSEEHTSELQSPTNLVCRLLLEKKRHLLTGGRTSVAIRGPQHSREHHVRAAPSGPGSHDPSRSAVFLNKTGPPQTNPFSPPDPFPI